jgi:hypothetical protein
MEVKKDGRVVWQYTPVIPALGKLSQEDLKFKGSKGKTLRKAWEERRKRRQEGRKAGGKEGGRELGEL